MSRREYPANWYVLWWYLNLVLSYSYLSLYRDILVSWYKDPTPMLKIRIRWCGKLLDTSVLTKGIMSHREYPANWYVLWWYLNLVLSYSYLSLYRDILVSWYKDPTPMLKIRIRWCGKLRINSGFIVLRLINSIPKQYNESISLVEMGVKKYLFNRESRQIAICVY
jgi:hypothetical protein